MTTGLLHCTCAHVAGMSLSCNFIQNCVGCHAVQHTATQAALSKLQQKSSKCLKQQHTSQATKYSTRIQISPCIIATAASSFIAGYQAWNKQVWLQVPHGSLGKGSGTPKNLARSHVLVAKVLTNSDTHGRIILPRVSVEANLTFLMGYRCPPPPPFTYHPVALAWSVSSSSSLHCSALSTFSFLST